MFRSPFLSQAAVRVGMELREYNFQHSNHSTTQPPYSFTYLPMTKSSSLITKSASLRLFGTTFFASSRKTGFHKFLQWWSLGKVKVPVSLIFDNCMYCLGNFLTSIFCSTHSPSVSSSLVAVFDRLSCSSALLAVFPIKAVEVDLGCKRKHKA